MEGSFLSSFLPVVLVAVVVSVIGVRGVGFCDVCKGWLGSVREGVLGEGRVGCPGIGGGLDAGEYPAKEIFVVGGVTV